MLALVGKDSVVMDVGADFGALTVPLAQKLAHVYAFEPQREAFYALAANMALSNLSNVTCENAVLAATAGLTRVPRLDFGASNKIGGLSLDRLPRAPLATKCAAKRSTNTPGATKSLVSTFRRSTLKEWKRRCCAVERGLSSACAL